MFCFFLGAKRRGSIKVKTTATDKSIELFFRIFAAELKIVRLGQGLRPYCVQLNHFTHSLSFYKNLKAREMAGGG
jgi:hypothetical protein